MKQYIKNVKIVCTGSYTPKKICSNKDLEKLVDTNDKWIRENLGISERRIADDEECTSDLASKAALNAIQSSDLKVSELDLIIVATATPDRLAHTLQLLLIFQQFVVAFYTVCQ